MKFLLWVGLVARNRDGSIAWPIRFAPKWVWRDWATLRGRMKFFGPVYVFRNSPGIIKWVPGRLLPRRWGIGFFGLVEFGDRGH